MAHEEILKERGSMYGRFEDNAGCTGELMDIFNTYLGENPYWNHLTLKQKVQFQTGIIMVLHKLGRIACGKLDIKDNFVDGENYLELLWKMIEGWKLEGGSDV